MVLLTSLALAKLLGFSKGKQLQPKGPLYISFLMVTLSQRTLRCVE